MKRIIFDSFFITPSFKRRLSILLKGLFVTIMAFIGFINLLNYIEYCKGILCSLGLFSLIGYCKGFIIESRGLLTKEISSFTKANSKEFIRFYSSSSTSPIKEENFVKNDEEFFSFDTKPTIYLDEEKDYDKIVVINSIRDRLSKYYSGYTGDLDALNNSNSSNYVDQVYEIYDLLSAINKEVCSINKLGYINNFSITDISQFPLTAKTLDCLLATDKNNQKYLMSDLDDKDKTELSKWWFNLIYLDLYYTLILITKSFTKEELGEDFYNDLTVFAKESKTGLESYIKLGLKRSGLTILQNTYTGFDTEFHHQKDISNQLLSVQLTACSRLILKISTPVAVYEYKGVNSFDGQVYDKTKKAFLDENFIFDGIDRDIRNLRELLYPGYDACINKIVTLLKKRVISVEKGSFTYFMMDKSVLKSWFSTDVEKGFTLAELVKISNQLTEKDLAVDLDKMYNLLNDLSVSKPIVVNNNKNKIKEDLSLDIVFNNQVFHNEDLFEQGVNLTVSKGVDIEDYHSGKKYIRTYKQTFTPEKTSVTIIRNNYIIAHLTAADLSMLKDFKDFKDQIDIVNSSIVTLKQPLLIDGVNVIIRDTMLLAPAGSKSLASIGDLYNLPKIDIGSKINHMNILLKEDPDLFKKYAMQDAKIALIHGLYMEEFAFKFGMIGIPLSLSMLSSVYLRKNWDVNGYKGYQVSPEYYLNDSSKTQTPKGLFAVGSMGLYISNYIANYKGGRNESFMYGRDKNFKWFDYDLVSAYTTGMSIMGNPKYKGIKTISVTELNSLSNYDLIFNYLIIKTDFKFPKSTKYPSIPCFMDEVITLYPLKGSAILTGMEYLVAKNQGCSFEIESIYYLPSEMNTWHKLVEEYRESNNNNNKSNKINKIIPKINKINKINKQIAVLDHPLAFLTNQPFKDVIKELQSKRRRSVKRSLNDKLYKELGNSLYGLIVKGISNKKKYDVRLGQTVRMEGNDLSNPILASWITAFIRSVIGEMLHNIHKLGGKVVSVTTDGFITDIEDLETKLLSLPTGNDLLKVYKKARVILTSDDANGFNDRALEIKSSGTDLFSWTTRGQFSPDGVVATTGFQRGLYSYEELKLLLIDGFSNGNKEITYINKRLRSATDVFKFGGHVVSEHKDQVFRLYYDNKRRIRDKGIEFKGDILLDSDPVNDIYEAQMYRSLAKKITVKKYQVQLQEKMHKNKYKNVLDIAVRNFIRCLLTDSLGLDYKVFGSYAEVAAFVNSYDDSVKITPNTIALLKRRLVKPKVLYKDSTTESFIEYVKLKFPNFDDKKFLNEFKD